MNKNLICSAIADTRNVLKRAGMDPVIDTGFLNMLEASGLRRASDLDNKMHLLHLVEHFDPDGVAKLEPEHLHILKDMEDMANFFDKKMKPGFFTNNFMALWRDAQFQAQGMFTDPHNATMIQMRNFLNVHRTGGKYLWQAAEHEEGNKFRKKYFFWFPDTIANQQKPYDLTFERTILKGVDVDGSFREVLGMRSTSTMGKLHETLTRLTDEMSGMQDMLKKTKIQQFELFEAVAAQSATDAEIIFDYAVAVRELANAKEGVADDPFLVSFQKARAAFDSLAEKEYNSPVDLVTGNALPTPQKVTAEQIVQSLNGIITKRFREDYETFVSGRVIGKDGVTYRGDQVLIRRVDARGNDYVDVEASLNAINEVTRYQDKKNPAIIGINPLSEIVHEMQFRQIWERVKDSKKYRDMPEKDGMALLRSTMKRKGINPDFVFPRQFETYFPHMNHPKKVIDDFAERRFLERVQKELDNDKSLANSNILDIPYLKAVYEESREIASILDNDANTVGDPTRDIISELDEIGEREWTDDADAAIERLANNRRSKNLMRRSEDDVMPGWTKGYRDIDSYENNLVSSYYRTLMSISGQVEINKFTQRQKKKNNYDQVETKKWATFMRIYVKDNLGYPSIFTTKEFSELPELRSGPYWFLTDHYIVDKYLKSFMKTGGKVDKLVKSLHNSPTNRGTYVAALRAFGVIGKDAYNALPSTTKDSLEARYRLYEHIKGSGWLSSFSNMEAKYQLITLLSRPKNWVNNIVGGDPNTIISTGWDHWRNTMSISYLKNNINPMWQSMADVYAWAESHGALESFLSNELSVANKTGDHNIKRGLDALANAIKKDANIDDRTLVEVWKKEGLEEALFNKVAFFMRSSERHLRYRSFMAHYLKAREVYEVSGRTISPDDPLLIEKALKGVAATQFLYNNANRPAFSRTSLGKVLSRFQLWGWNSTRMRTEILRDMSELGISPNSDAAKKFQRMALIDTFVLALAAALPFSVFDMTIPQPWAWLKDTAEWLFGDDEEKERAFIGGLPPQVAPLSIVLPPSSRFITPIIGSLWSGDWDRFFSYHIWSYLPYGLMGRDVWNSVENPVNIPQYMLGLPLVQLGRNVAARRKNDEVGWGPYYRTEPIEDPEE